MTVSDLSERLLDRDGEDIIITMRVIKNSSLMDMDVVGPEWLDKADLAICLRTLLDSL